MKILLDGKEVKDATIVYDVTGRPDMITVKGVFYDINAFELVDTVPVVKTKNVIKNVIKKVKKQ